MSIKIMSMIWENGPDDRGELLVLLALADFADDRGRCWPSIATIARRARMTARSAQRILRKLEADGAVEISTGAARSGCNQYKITPDTVSPRHSVTPDARVIPPPDARVTPPLTPVSPEPLLNHQLEPSEDISCAKDEFLQFWDRYPRKISKAAARKAYVKALKTETHDRIMYGLSQQMPSLAAREAQFIPHPATWLDQERWNDEPEQPASNIKHPGTDAADRQIAFAAAARRTPSQDCF
jgi:DNA-binding MarR family transcriptional regulator